MKLLLRLLRFFFLLTTAFLVFSCAKTEGLTTPAFEKKIAAAEGINPLPYNLLDSAYRPVVMVHGFLASGDTWAPFAQLFTSNGYPWKKMFVFDWNSLNAGANQNAALNALIDNILLKTNADKVDLIGHSAGGGVCYTYLKEPKNAAKVAHYAHVASSNQPGPAGAAGEVPTMNLWSDGDKVVAGGNINGAINVLLKEKDHYEVATSTESFGKIFEFFQNRKADRLDYTVEEQPCIAGRALTFGENQPIANATIAIYEVDAKSGQRIGSAIAMVQTDQEGIWPAVVIKPNTRYEITVTESVSGKKTIHYYREGFVHTNFLVYLRTIPPPTSLAGILLSGLPTDPAQTVLNVFSASSAMISGRDSLVVDGQFLTSNAIAPASKTMIALFLYDTGNKKTDLTALPLFGSFTFLNGIDVFFDTSLTSPILCRKNDRTLALGRWPGDKDIVIAVFD